MMQLSDMDLATPEPAAAPVRTPTGYAGGSRLLRNDTTTLAGTHQAGLPP